MQKKAPKANMSFFAAANSYNGFVSYFDKVFPSEEFDRIYVLKGGPGTGKSSFMKKLAGALLEKECKVQEIFCSSDPHSLDGVIAEKNDRRIAMVDGTAPHERDAVIPGAIDEIINLGDCWERRWLVGQKDNIKRLAKEKSNAYKTAYSYLSIAGKSNELIKNFEFSHFNEIKAKYEAEKLFANIISDEFCSVTTMLIDSFGRYGEYRIDSLQGLAKNNVSIGGDAISASHFLDICSDVLKEKNVSFTHFPLALDPASTDAIYIPGADIAITRSNTGKINADDFLKDDLCRERTKRAKTIKIDALDEAKRWFGIASEIHFQLEEIYGKAMNFEQNDLIFKERISEIENILEI